jgi:hypothetical protein
VPAEQDQDLAAIAARFHAEYAAGHVTGHLQLSGRAGSLLSLDSAAAITEAGAQAVTEAVRA